MGKELEIYKNQLTRAFPPPEGCYFKVEWSSHDFGRYGEVRAVWPGGFEEGDEWALGAENSVDHWDPPRPPKKGAQRVFEWPWRALPQAGPRPFKGPSPKTRPEAEAKCESN